MSKDVLFERDMLYPTGNINEPGSIHIQVLSPNKIAKIPVVIECKTNHSPLKFLDTIIRIMQTDIFDRIFVDMSKNTTLYIKAGNELLAESGGKPYIKVSHGDAGFEFTGAEAAE